MLRNAALVAIAASLAFAAPAPAPQITLIESDIGFLGPATLFHVTATYDGIPITAVVPFPTFVPQALIPVAESVFLKERQVTVLDSTIGFLGPATVTATYDGIPITAVVPFPTFVPQALIPIAESVFLKEARAEPTPL